jgi:acyl-CoA reductase-like NAD-dependent aldehyde dehydrogenase
VQNEATIGRVNNARTLGKVVRDSSPVAIAGFENARTASPLVVAIDASNETTWGEERFGPIAFVIRTGSTGESIALASDSARKKGAITASVYSANEEVVAAAAKAFARAGVALSVNLTGGLYVNQSAAFSDYHVTGANPAGNACLTDSAFVANRFRVATVRRQKLPDHFKRKYSKGGLLQ